MLKFSRYCCEALVAAALGLSVFAPMLAQAQTPPNSPSKKPPQTSTEKAEIPESSMPTSGEVVYQMLLAETLMLQQQFQDAYSLFMEAARASRNPQVYKRAAEAAWRAGLGEQALSASRQWADLSPDDSEATRVLTQVYATLNRPRDAVPYLKRELARTPEADKPSTILSLNRLLLTATEKQAAYEATRDWLQSEGSRPEAQIALARAAFATNRTKEAWAALGNASAAKPDAPSAVILAIENLERDPEQAIAIGRAYTRSAKTLDAPTAELMRRLTASGRIPQALIMAEEAAKYHPKQAESWLLLGNLQDQANQSDAADKAYLKAVQVAQSTDAAADALAQSPERPSSADAALIALAANAERKRDYSGAENYIRQIKKSELQSEARLRLVASALRAKDMRTAWALVNGLPESTAAQRAAKLGLTGQVLRAESKFDQSFAAYEKAVTESPDDADLLYEASFAAERVKQWDRMETLLRQVIELKPEFAHAYNSLGYTLADRGVRLDESLQLIKKAVALSKDDPFIMDSLGWVLYRTGDKDEALQTLQKAYRIRQDPEIAAHLGEVLWELGRKDEALRTWKDAMATHGPGAKKTASAGAEQTEREVDISILKDTLKRYQIND